MRQLRRTGERGAAGESTKTWRIGRITLRRFSLRPDWRLRSPRVETLLKELDEAVSTRVGELFQVRQGIRTGANEVFLLSAADWEALPPEERSFFRKAITNSAIRQGRLESSEYVFYPYSKGQILFESEEEAAESLHTYFERYVLPNAPTLKARSTVSQGNQLWWTLTRFRSFETGGRPRVVSKYFGGIGGFAADLGGDLAVVQGQSWYPLSGLVRASTAATKRMPGGVSNGFVGAYAAMFNTRVFATLLDAYSTPVAGGQYDLSARYMNAINLPDLGVLFDDSGRRSTVVALERLGSEIRTDDPSWLREADEAAAEAYGTSLGGFLGL